jgi:hypothetical protein
VWAASLTLAPSLASAQQPPPARPPPAAQSVPEFAPPANVPAPPGANAPSSVAPPTGPVAAGGPATESAGEAPFAFGDFTWMNGQSRQKDFPLQLSKYVTVSLYLDAYYAYSANAPRDNTLTGSASVGRHNEFQINLASVGAEWNYKNVIGRLSLQAGSMLNIVQDLDGTVARGRSLTTQNLRYIREATLGYHFDVAHGLNVEGGIFMSYIGLESYLLAENWNYNRSLVCDFTPFYFTGVRAQFYPARNVKIEPWLMNGWQSYGNWNKAPSAGMATRWSPREALSLMLNLYVGNDTRNDESRIRFHSDHSIVGRYYHEPESGFLSKAAFSINNHAGFESGGAGTGLEDAHMVGTSIANRFWFARDTYALTVRAEAISNKGRYLAQYPAPGFASGNGEDLRMLGLTVTGEVMPTDFLSFRAEMVARRSSVPFFAGRRGTTSPDGFQDTADPSFVPDVSRGQVLFTVSANARL